MSFRSYRPGEYLKRVVLLFQVPCHSLPCLRSGSKFKLVSTSGSEEVSAPVLQTKHVYLPQFFHQIPPSPLKKKKKKINCAIR